MPNPSLATCFIMPHYLHFFAEATNGKTKEKTFKLVYGKFYFIFGVLNFITRFLQLSLLEN